MLWCHNTIGLGALRVLHTAHSVKDPPAHAIINTAHVHVTKRNEGKTYGIVQYGTWASYSNSFHKRSDTTPSLAWEGALTVYPPHRTHSVCLRLGFIQLVDCLRSDILSSITLHAPSPTPTDPKRSMRSPSRLLPRVDAEPDRRRSQCRNAQHDASTRLSLHEKRLALVVCLHGVVANRHITHLCFEPRNFL